MFLPLLAWPLPMWRGFIVEAFFIIWAQPVFGLARQWLNNAEMKVEVNQFTAVMYTSSGSLIYSVRAKLKLKYTNTCTLTSTSTMWNGQPPLCKVLLQLIPFPERQSIDVLLHKTTFTKDNGIVAPTVFCKSDVALGHGVNWLLLMRTTPLRFLKVEIPSKVIFPYTQGPWFPWRGRQCTRSS